MAVRVAEVVLLSVVVALIAALLYDPGTSEGFPREPIPETQVNSDLFDRTYEHFDSQGLKLEAWLYTPKNTPNPPVVIMAHGLGMTKYFKLDQYAEIFAKKGIAAFVFDYRHFGGSEGEPRNLVKVSKQIADYHAAIKHVTTLKGINSNKIGLWGTSFSGGHVLTVASEQITRKNPNVTCVVSQIPYLDSLDSVARTDASASQLLNLFAAALKDLVLSFFGKDQYVPLIGDQQAISILHQDKPEESLSVLGAKNGKFGWYNKVPARTLLEVVLYRPHMVASSVTLPSLVVYAADDELISAAQVEKTAATMPNVTLIKVEGDHFAVYKRDDIIEKEADFLAKHLL